MILSPPLPNKTGLLPQNNELLQIAPLQALWGLSRLKKGKLELDTALECARPSAAQPGPRLLPIHDTLKSPEELPTMNVFVTQIYVEPACSYPFSHHFQRLIHSELSERIAPSPVFLQQYAGDFTLVFNMSAKSTLSDPEIYGPTVFKKTRDVEYSIFLPFDVDKEFGPSLYRHVLKQLFEQIAKVLTSLKMDTKQVSEDADEIIERIVADPKMFQFN